MTAPHLTLEIFHILLFSDCQNQDRRINSRPARKMHPIFKGSIAQLVEQWIENSRVAGSIPARATFFHLEGGHAKSALVNGFCPPADPLAQS